MTEPKRDSRWTDDQVELFVGNLLRYGVMAAALVAFVGGVIFLLHHGNATADYRRFDGEPAGLRSITGVVSGAVRLEGRSVIQLGLLLLIATPVARVAFSLLAFVRQRDRTYVVITAIVLALLLYSLLGPK